MTYVTAKVPIKVEEIEAGYFVAKCPLLNNLSRSGSTKANAIKSIKSAIDYYFEEG